MPAGVNSYVLPLQVTAVHREVHAQNGGQGQIWRLRDHLMPDKPKMA